MNKSFAEIRLLTVAEVASTMRVSTMTVYRMVHSGELPAIRFGRSFRILESAVTHIVGEPVVSKNFDQVG
jgi:excisionase family DNA binding protein